MTAATHSPTLSTPLPPPLSTAIEGLQNIPLGKILPNPNNPRKNFDRKSLEELAESIRAHGVRQPVLVRPNGSPGKYELVVGERRWRASKIAGKPEIPAIVDPNLTDAQALEIMVIENLQREDIQALDEALGYQALLKQDKASTVETIAAKVGKSTSYVYQRLKLTALIPAAQDALRDDRITAGHAILIARLQPPDQMKALTESCSTITDYQSKEKYVETCSVRDLANWIRHNIMLALDSAPWDLESTTLVPAAGPCTLCPKRSGANPALFADVQTGDVCMDPTCYTKKKTAFIALQEAKAMDQAVREHPEKSSLNPGTVKISTEYSSRDRSVHCSDGWRKAAKGSCAFVKTAVVAESRDDSKIGKIERVCLAKQSCEKHWPESAGTKNDRLNSFSRNDNKESERLRKIDDAYFQGVIATIFKAAGKPVRKDWELIAESLFETARMDMDEEAICAALAIPDTRITKYITALSDAALTRFVLASGAAASLSRVKTAEEMGKRHKINLPQIRKDARALYPNEKVQTSAKKGKAKP